LDGLGGPKQEFDGHHDVYPGAASGQIDFRTNALNLFPMRHWTRIIETGFECAKPTHLYYYNNCYGRSPTFRSSLNPRQEPRSQYVIHLLLSTRFQNSDRQE
jgi:hypothetical protein